MARRAKLTQEMVDEAIRLKGDGLADADIICALGIHPSTFYRWKNEPKNRLQRELGEGLKKEEAEFKHTLLTTIRAAALARNQYWTAAAWLLERKYPDEYGKADRRMTRPGSCWAWWQSRCRRGWTFPSTGRRSGLKATWALLDRLATTAARVLHRGRVRLLHLTLRTGSSREQDRSERPGDTGVPRRAGGRDVPWAFALLNAWWAW